MNNDGYAKAKATADKLKAETDEVQEEKALAKQEVLSSLEALQGNSRLLKMYQDKAGAGSENLTGELPQLKIHTANKSLGDELADGSEPSDGYFFLKSEGKQFKVAECYILHVSDGFRTDGMQSEGQDVKKNVFNQIVAGVIDDEGDYKAFIMYFAGMKLQGLWEFGKAAARYTKGKMRLPLFALRVRLTTEKVKHSYGQSWVAKFEILRDAEGNPQLVLDEGLFTFLSDSREQAVETIDRLIAAKATEETVEVVHAETVDEFKEEVGLPPEGAEDSGAESLF